MLNLCQIFTYIRPDRAIYHLAAVDLIWALEGATNKPHLESIIAQRMMAPTSEQRQEAFEAFGVLWRLTGRMRTRTELRSLLKFHRARG